MNEPDMKVAPVESDRRTTATSTKKIATAFNPVFASRQSSAQTACKEEMIFFLRFMSKNEPTAKATIKAAKGASHAYTPNAGCSFASAVTFAVYNVVMLSPKKASAFIRLINGRFGPIASLIFVSSYFYFISKIKIICLLRVLLPPLPGAPLAKVAVVVLLFLLRHPEALAPGQLPERFVFVAQV